MGEPRASRPYWPDYPLPRSDLLPWGWAEDKLASSRNYFISTTRLDGAPHTAIVWGVWLEGSLYFSTGASSRKARNPAQEPRCTIATDRADDAVILEGEAELSAMPPALPAIYEAKYNWVVEPGLGPLFVVRPRVVFAFREQAMSETTRWTFA
ncbi:MAG: pyridoxamine 5'-phosphate oxidase family protein [Chloroflexota bacterium]